MMLYNELWLHKSRSLSLMIFIVLYFQESMWDSQYKHYQAIIDYINEHRDIYHTDIRFGTLSDYFDEVNARMKVNYISMEILFHYVIIFLFKISLEWLQFFLLFNNRSEMTGSNDLVYLPNILWAGEVENPAVGVFLWFSKAMLKSS